MIWSTFTISIFYKFVFPDFFTFERYFKVGEYQNRTQHEKNTPGVLSLGFFARWEARTALRKPPGDPPGVPLGSPPGEENYFDFKFPPR